MTQVKTILDRRPRVAGLNGRDTMRKCDLSRIALREW